jgi:hypothetical protein
LGVVDAEQTPPAAVGEIADEALVDRRVLEREGVDVLSQRQLGDASCAAMTLPFPVIED